jgi:hypothetical protein
MELTSLYSSRPDLSICLAGAVTVTVCASGSCDYTKISSALGSVGPDTTVQVSAGSYIDNTNVIVSSANVELVYGLPLCLSPRRRARLF